MESAKEKTGMQRARELSQKKRNELIESFDIETLDTENLKLLERVLSINKDLLITEKAIQNAYKKNLKTQQKIFFFFAVLFFSEIIYSLLIGSGYVEPINLKALMLVFIFLLMAFAYTQFRN